LRWLNTHPQVYQEQLKINKAQQKVIQSKHVVQIPIAKNASLFFTKSDGQLKVYAYKWRDDAPGNKLYSGSIAAYSFQSNTIQEQKYVKDVVTERGQLVAKKSTVATQSIKQVNDSFDTALAKFWCWLTSGNYISQEDIDSGNSAGANGEVGKTGCDYAGGDGGGGSSGGSSGGEAPEYGDFVVISGPSNTGDTDYGGDNYYVKVYNGSSGSDQQEIPRDDGSDENWVYYTLSVAQQLANIIPLTPFENSWLTINPAMADMLFTYLKQQNSSQYSRDQIVWSINYLSTNLSVDVNVFKNQFLGVSEGQENDYDASFWNDATLSYPQQNLPTWDNFISAFPVNTNPSFSTPQKMYSAIGGDVANFYVNENTNTCAVRLSRGLNYSGVTIPHIVNKTFKGADNKYYFIRAADINNWMRLTFGTNDGDPKAPHNGNHYHYTGSQAGEHGVNLPGLLSGKKGIYSLVSSDLRWASGHADLLYSNGTCGNECHFYDAPILYLDIWVLN
jgi:hypothetical protein